MVQIGALEMDIVVSILLAVGDITEIPLRCLVVWTILCDIYDFAFFVFVG